MLKQLCYITLLFCITTASYALEVTGKQLILLMIEEENIVKCEFITESPLIFHEEDWTTETYTGACLTTESVIDIVTKISFKEHADDPTEFMLEEGIPLPWAENLCAISGNIIKTPDDIVLKEQKGLKKLFKKQPESVHFKLTDVIYQCNGSTTRVTDNDTAEFIVKF